ncbi:MAG TPA: PD-(D/E)XK nuclease family protein, partial [Candidatus Limnocylindrales bacterium]|nr:PD-(D/E)XK nuclease family protein [Candidatus Limnocylindrales bacterium]
MADEPPPSLVVPGGEADRLVFVERDRQEELIAIVRRIEVLQDGTSGGRTAVVFKRPLPYLYLAGQVFGRARIPYHASDRLPLAAEPFAAALDVVFEFVESGFTRRSAVALLRSPHFRFEHETRTVELAAVSALDRALSDKRYLGGLDLLVRMCEQWNAADDRKYPGARPALGAVRSAAETLAPLLVAGAASAQLRRVIEFLDRHARPASDKTIGAALGRRLSRARKAIVDAIDSLARAHAAHDDRPVAMADIAVEVRHVIGGLAFLPEAGEAGVELLDAEAARYGRFAAMAIVGLVEGEWPDPPKRNIFYSTSLLVSLGWPMQKDRRSAMETRFVELLGSASGRVSVSTFRLEDETLVEPSAFVDEIPRARLLTVPVGAASFEESGTLFADEALALEPVPLDALDAEAREWAEMRLARPSGEAPAFHGQTGSLPGKPWSVSALETYLGCPFKFFAQHVLRLQEEPEDEEVMDPRSQGEFMHGVFEAFFARWQRDGHGAITPANFDVARAMFTDVVDQQLGGLSGSEAALERTRLLGSPASAGLGEA